MRLKIEHRTRYAYSEAVSENYNEVRLQPVSDERQECHGYRLVTRPGGRIGRYHDFHLNLVDHFYLVDPHEFLEIEVVSEVTTESGSAWPADGQAGSSRRDLAGCQRMEFCHDFLQRSEYVSLGVEVWREAHDVGIGIDDVGELAWAVARHVGRTLQYEPGSTSVGTLMEDVLVQRRGVCQDFAHVMLGMCRSLKIPARYVSGYLHVPPGEHWRGAEASHAWVEVYLPKVGWRGLDPTNACAVGESHVKVAVGRDYADAAPVRGNFRGRARQRMEVDLSVTVVSPPGTLSDDSSQTFI